MEYIKSLLDQPLTVRLFLKIFLLALSTISMINCILFLFLVIWKTNIKEFKYFIVPFAIVTIFSFILFFIGYFLL